MKYYILSLSITLIDQITKMMVHLNMQVGEEVRVLGDWFRLHYVLNPGIAFGLEFDFPYGKLLLTIFRIVAVAGIGYYLFYLSLRNSHRYVLLALSLVLAGALGNVIDSTFYGVILDNAPKDAFTPWFHGQVIDMLYFPVFYGKFPEWVPLLGSQNFQFFRPVFNLADASIFMGVTFILVLHQKYSLIGPGTEKEIKLKTKSL